MVKMLYPDVAKYLNDEWLKFFMKRGAVYLRRTSQPIVAYRKQTCLGI